LGDLATTFALAAAAAAATIGPVTFSAFNLAFSLPSSATTFALAASGGCSFSSASTTVGFFRFALAPSTLAFLTSAFNLAFSRTS
jgi:hypothetical protein